MRVLELFCGIGGCAAALGEQARTTLAVDLHLGALAVYRANFPHPTRAAALESLPAAALAAAEADLWWLSPPCQPHTVRGARRDDLDPRSKPLHALLPRIGELQPRYVALENVPGFAGSRSRGRLLAALADAGYAWQELELCPTELGWPNRRRRYYLVAARAGETLRPFPLAPAPAPRLADLLEAAPSAELEVPAELVARYPHALDIVAADDPAAVTACFTAAYGQSPVRSGSYLSTATGLRRFSPAEILRLLGFPSSYRLPAELPAKAAWRLVGNSLSLVAVRRVLAAVPELSALDAGAGAPSRLPARRE